MPTPAHIPLANLTLVSNQQTITFSGIPSSVSGTSLRDLVLVVRGSTALGNRSVLIRLNGDSANNYARVIMQAFGSSPSVEAAATQPFIFVGGANEDDLNGGGFSVEIADFSQTNKHKNAISTLFQRGGSGIYQGAHRWASTAAVTSLTVYMDSGEFSAGSTFNLYAIAG